MFQKILIAEDVASINIGIKAILDSLAIPEIAHSDYCYGAYLKAKKAILDQQAFELLICDLSFTPDHRDQKIRSGQELIQLLKKELPNLKIIVFTVEDNSNIVKALWEDVKVDGYVCKGRDGTKELLEAIQSVYNKERFLSTQLKTALKQDNTFILSTYDEQLLQLLAAGYTQDQIELKFKEDGVSPSSRSSIEKRLKDLREEFDAQTTVHLIALLLGDKKL